MRSRYGRASRPKSSHAEVPEGKRIVEEPRTRAGLRRRLAALQAEGSRYRYRIHVALIDGRRNLLVYSRIR